MFDRIYDSGNVLVEKPPPYDIVLTDCPWHYYGSPDKDAAAGKHYDLMEDMDLSKLDVRGLVGKSAALFMWATCPRLNFAFDLIRDWGFHYRGVAWVWVKTRLDGGVIHGQGVPPTFTKPTTELILAATTKPRGRPWPIQTSRMGQVVDEPMLGEPIYEPRTPVHSEKPKRFHRLIEELAGPDPRKIEIFCRGVPEPTWHGWGKQCGPQPPPKGSVLDFFG
jgi:N6-adenosine-specific RNA methylase IME4